MATFHVLKLRNGQQESVKILHKNESLAKYVSEIFSPVADYKTIDVCTELGFGAGRLRQRWEAERWPAAGPSWGRDATG